MSSDWQWTDEDSDDLDKRNKELRKAEKRARSAAALGGIIPTADQQKILGYPLRDSHLFDSMHRKTGRPKKAQGVIEQIVNAPEEDQL